MGEAERRIGGEVLQVSREHLCVFYGAERRGSKAGEQPPSAPRVVSLPGAGHHTAAEAAPQQAAFPLSAVHLPEEGGARGPDGLVQGT